jgi:hypothetical protein
VRRLTIRNSVGRFLQADYLTVRKLAAVVHEGHRADGGTHIAGTPRWLFDFAAVDLDLHGVRAGEAPEKGNFHIWDDGCRADNEAFNAYQLVGVYAVSEANHF